jgi:hypothetical protein
VLKESAGSDTFLGRQHYQIIPLPHEDECHQSPALLVDATTRWCDRWSFAGLDHGAIGWPESGAPLALPLNYRRQTATGPGPTTTGAGPMTRCQTRPSSNWMRMPSGE